MKEKKKKKGLARLMEIAGQRKGLLIVAGTLSALSSACMLVPYWAVYEVLRLLLTGNAASGEMVHWGWVAFGGLVAGLVLLYLALMASHVAAFNVLYGLRIRITEHIGRLSLGYLNGTTTGAIKKTMEQNVEKIETFIAHTIPDLVGIVATVADLLRSLIPTVNPSSPRTDIRNNGRSPYGLRPLLLKSPFYWMVICLTASFFAVTSFFGR